jgi:hypothetical protein
MKRIFFLIIICSGGQLLRGQTAATLQLQSGVHLKTQGGAYLVLNEANLLNNGGVIQHGVGQGVIKFTGGAPVTISGSDPIQVDKLELAKQAGTVLGLVAISVWALRLHLTVVC